MLVVFCVILHVYDILFIYVVGSFHLLHLMFDDYVLYQVEQLHSQERARELLRKVKGEEGDGKYKVDGLNALRPVLVISQTSLWIINY